ncbi:hypothetical protein HYT17_02600 [Candidatus Microgenomates bacterium]|nr:hypothetical protein [Candidatus Microgenomates bacterium]
MQEEFKLLFSDKANKYGLLLSLGLLFFGLLIFLLKVWSLPPLVPLFYSRPWGISQLGTPLSLLLVLLFGFLVVTINLSISLKLWRNMLILTRILFWVSVVVALLATTTVIQVILLTT